MCVWNIPIDDDETNEHPVNWAKQMTSPGFLRKFIAPVMANYDHNF